MLHPSEVFAQTRPYLITCVGGTAFHIRHPRFAQSLLFDSVPSRGCTLIMTVALILDSQAWPSTSINNEDIDALAINGPKRILTARSKYFAKAGLRENAITRTLCSDLLFDNGEDTILRSAKHALLLE